MLKDILVYGPARAGKSELVLGFAERRNLKTFAVIVDFMYRGQNINHNMIACVVERDDGAFLIRTVRGGFISRNVWDEYIHKCDGIMVALKSDPSTQKSNLIMVGHLAEVLGGVAKVGCIVCMNMHAGMDVLPVMSTAMRARAILGCEHWPIFHSDAGRPESDDAPLVSMMESLKT